MGNELNLRDPEIEFDYISDKILWEKILGDLYPLDINDPESDEIKLGYYFKTALVNIKNSNHKTRMIFPEQSFFYDTHQERCEAFGLLCDILIRFKKPVSGIFIEIPKHNSVAKRVDFSPAHIYYDGTEYPLLNKERDRIEISLTEKTFIEFYKYCFAKEPDINNGSRSLRFSFLCFRGFMLPQ
jgi:hypothetical protein